MPALRRGLLGTFYKNFLTVMFKYRYHIFSLYYGLVEWSPLRDLRGSFWVRIPTAVVFLHKGDARKSNGILKRQKKPSLGFFWRFKIPRMTQVCFSSNLVYVYRSILIIFLNLNTICQHDCLFFYR